MVWFNIYLNQVFRNLAYIAKYLSKHTPELKHYENVCVCGITYRQAEKPDKLFHVEKRLCEGKEMKAEIPSDKIITHETICVCTCLEITYTQIHEKCDLPIIQNYIYLVHVH